MFPQTVELNENNIKKLTTLYNKAYGQIVGELEGATSFGVANRKAILQQVENILTELGGEVNTTLQKEIKKYYEVGAKDGVLQLQKVNADVAVASGFNRIHKEAITSLVDDAQTSFGDSLTGVGRSTQLALNKATKEQLTTQMAIGKVGGKSLDSIKAVLSGTLRQQGLPALKDKSGRTWSLDRYTEMLARTKAVEARNRGLANRVAENGYDLVQVSSHGADDVCGDWEGMILSVSGQTDGYPTVSDAEADGLFHPNCKHAINVLVPELAKLTNAYLPDDETMSGEEFYAKYYQAG